MTIKRRRIGLRLIDIKLIYTMMAAMWTLPKTDEYRATSHWRRIGSELSKRCLRTLTKLDTQRGRRRTDMLTMFVDLHRTPCFMFLSKSECKLIIRMCYAFESVDWKAQRASAVFPATPPGYSQRTLHALAHDIEQLLAKFEDE